MLKMRQSRDLLIFNMGFHILVRLHLYIETALRASFQYKDHLYVYSRAVTSTDFRNRLTVPPNLNRIRLTERFASPYGALCFHVFTGSDFPPGPSRLSLQVLSLLVSNQTSFRQMKRQSKIITWGVLVHKNKSLTWCHSPTVPSRINAR